MVRNEIRLYVCEDEKWGLAKRYRHAGEETSAIGAAKMSLLASSCIAAMVAHCFTDQKDGTPCYFSLFYSDKPGVKVPSPPLLGRLSLQRPALPAAPAKPAEEAKAQPAREPAPPPPPKAAPRAAAAPAPRAAPERPPVRPGGPEDRRPSGQGAAPPAPAPSRSAPQTVEASAGMSPRAAPAMSAMSRDAAIAPSPGAPVPQALTASPFSMASPIAAAAPFGSADLAAPPRAAAAAAVTPALQESRARLLQFLEACLTHPITQKYLPSGELDPKNRFGLHLLALGAGQACVTAADEETLLLADIVEAALAVLGSDSQKARAFAESVADYAGEPKNAAMIQAGQEIMATFLRDKTLPGGPLNQALQLWNTAQRGDEALDGGSDIVIMFTDMVSSVETTQQLGDEGMMRLVDQHNLIIGAVLKTMRGHQVKHTGDGIMAVFPRVADGVAAAAEIQRQIADFNRTTQGAVLKVRIGLAAGNPIRKDDDYFGTVVQTAARVCPVAGAGEIALPDAVTRMPGCETYAYSEPIAVPLKGFSEPQLVRKLLWAEGMADASAG